MRVILNPKMYFGNKIRLSPVFQREPFHNEYYQLNNIIRIFYVVKVSF